MSVTSKIPNVVLLGLLVSLCLLSDRGFGTAETIVDTNPHAVLEVGTTGILPCRIQRRGYSVEWKRQLSSLSELLVSLDVLFDVGKRDGPGYEAGLFNITDDYSLVIKDVKVQDEGLYICLFSDYQTGKPFENSTRVSVQAFPDEPFPVIRECIGKDVNSGSCTLTIHQTYNLSCLVRGYYPDIDLFFLHGSEKVRSSGYEEWNNADMTKNKEIRVEINVSDEPYECVASGLPGIAGNRSVSVIVQARSQDRSQGSHPAAIAVPVLVVLVCLSIAVTVKCRLGKGRDSDEAKNEDPANECMISDSELSIWSGLILPGKYYYLSCSLSFKYSEAFDILSKHNGDTTEALKECASVWKKRTGGSWKELKEILHRPEKEDSDEASSENANPANGCMISDGQRINFSHYKPITQGKYYFQCYSLKLTYTKAAYILKKHNGDITEALIECGAIWMNMTGGSLTEVHEILQRIERADSDGALPKNANPANGDTVSDSKLDILSCRIPPMKYDTMCCNFGITSNVAIMILMRYSNDYARALRHCMAMWKNHTGGSCTELKEILKRADMESLVRHLE